MKIVAIIKASSISNYFPNRYELKLGDLSLLEFIIKRLEKSRFINGIILATTDDEIDNHLIIEAKRLGIAVYRGSYEDSIGRLYGAASLGKADILVKVLGNYPLVDPWETDIMIEEFITSNYTYGYNEHYEGIILGLGVEIFTYDLIEQTNSEIKNSLQRHLGTNIFRDSIDKRNTLIPKYPFLRPNYRVTLAVSEDVVILNQIIEECQELNYAGIVRYIDEQSIIVKYAQQNIAAPKETGVEKIFLFPEKIKSINQCSNNGADFSYPVSVELSLTNRCNLKCEWCSDIDLRKRSMGDIDFAVLEKLFRDLAKNGTSGIVVEGGGEPTIYQRFNDVLMCAKDYGFSLGLITNGVEIPYKDKLSYFDWIRVSLDAANGSQFSQGRERDLFDLVMSNIQIIARHREVNGLVAGVGYVLTKDNEKFLEDLVLNLRKINVNYFQIRPVVDHPELIPKKFELDYLLKYSTSEFFVHIENIRENTIRGNFNLPCRAHSLSSVITANGDVFLCGRLNIHNSIKPLGNLNKKSFSEIWHGEERTRQAKMVFDNDFCWKWCPECRLTKYNVMFDSSLKTKTKNFI